MVRSVTKINTVNSKFTRAAVAVEEHHDHIMTTLIVLALTKKCWDCSLSRSRAEFLTTQKELKGRKEEGVSKNTRAISRMPECVRE